MTHANAAHRAPAHREEGALRGRNGAKPSLSVILVSQGTRHDLERAVRVVAPSLRSMKAQLIVVRRNSEPTIEFLLSEAGPFETIRATDDCSRAEMVAMAMRAARGDIVAVREDLEVSDAEWLSGCRRILTSDGGHRGSELETPILPVAGDWRSGGRLVELVGEPVITMAASPAQVISDESSHAPDRTRRIEVVPDSVGRATQS